MSFVHDLAEFLLETGKFGLGGSWYRSRRIALFCFFARLFVSSRAYSSAAMDQAACTRSSFQGPAPNRQIPRTRHSSSVRATIRPFRAATIQRRQRTLRHRQLGRIAIDCRTSTARPTGAYRPAVRFGGCVRCREWPLGALAKVSCGIPTSLRESTLRHGRNLLWILTKAQMAVARKTPEVLVLR